ncbi:MAG TPA: restriction endonuclease subunit S [Anaerolineae bacterium]|nr:restriction endonuclease subunit S [Anaerolineae bacterium]HQH39125.1 restriction endonuclease subunit S [Anaerolineae bacterium]
MTSEWRTWKIGDIGKVVTGKTPSTRQPEYFGGEYPFITIPDLDGRRDISTSTRTLSQLGAESIRGCFLPTGAIMMSCIATIGKCGITTRPSFTNQQINSVVCRNDVYPKFLYYCFTQLGPALEAAGGGGSVYTNVSKSRFSAIEVTLPPLPEQRAIAHILGSLDDKIELNRQMNATLESLARAIFKSWFVDFDPVYAKANGDQPVGMDAATAALFPDDFKESELGAIPRGWRVGSILEFADLLSGGTPKTSEPDYWNGNIAWVSAKDVSNVSGVFLLDTERKISQAGVDNSSTKLLPAKTTIITARGTVGAHCLLGDPMTMNQTNYGLKAKKGVGDYFVYFSLKNLVERLRQQSYGTIFDTITTKTFRDTICIQPPHNLISAFENQIYPIMDATLNNQHQSRTLAELRDTLLPKLISGEVRVPEGFLQDVQD